jgi:hypothetical protein
MELLPDKNPTVTVLECHTDAEVDKARLHFEELKSTLLKLADNIPEATRVQIDESLTARQQAFIRWLASGEDGQSFEILAGESNFTTGCALKDWLGRLNLLRYAAAVAAWCDEQGAVCLSEIVENREDLAAALNDVMLPDDRLRLSSEAAVGAAEASSLCEYTSELQSLLGAVVGQMKHQTFEHIEHALTTTEKSLVLQSMPKVTSSDVKHERGSSPVKNVLCEGQSAVLEKVRVKTTEARHSSKRDQELLQLAAKSANSSEHNRCQDCRRVISSSAEAVGDDGLAYCQECWASWCSTSEGKSTESMQERTSSFDWIIAGGGC